MTSIYESPSERIVIAVDLDYFFAQCEEVRNPSLKNKPVVVCVLSGRTKYSGAVSTANYIARSLGVRSGIPIMSARKILSGHSEAVFMPLDQQFYDSISERVMQILRSHSSVFEQVSVDEAFLDVTSLSRGDFERASGIAREIKDEIQTREKLTCSIGVGPNKLIAKMSADYNKPSGLTVIPADKVRSFLKDQPVRKLIGIGPKTETRMEKLGIKTIEDLANHDVGILVENFGRNLGPHFKSLAQGIDNDPVREKPIEQLSRIITLKEDATSFSFGEQIKPLAKDLSERLKVLKLKARAIGIILVTSEIRTRSRVMTIGHPTDSYEQILDNSNALFKEYFMSDEDHVDTKIRRVGIRVSGFEKFISQEGKEEPESQGTLTNFLTFNSI